MDNSNKTNAFRNQVFRDILYGNYKIGEKLPTEREIAETNNISRITVRRAFNELEANGILERIQGSGTFVAEHQSANQNSGKLIALLSNVGDEFALGFIKAIERELAKNGEFMILRLTDDSPELEENAALDLVASGIKNLIIWPSGENFHAQTFERLRVLGVNMVFFDRMIPEEYADYVGLDNVDAIKQLFNYSANASKVAFVSHASINFDSDKMREIAFNKECKKRKVDGKVFYIADSIGPEMISELKQYEAILCVNDEMALRIMEIIPDAVVLGIDGLTKLVTSYAQPLDLMAKQVVNLLHSQRNFGDKWQASKVFIKGAVNEKL